VRVVLKARWLEDVDLVSMLPLISVSLLIMGALGTKRRLPDIESIGDKSASATLCRAEIYFAVAARACFALPRGLGASNEVYTRDSG
jgi:hypothetical protein